MEGGVASCGLGELSGGVDSPVMKEDPEEEGPGESTIIHLKGVIYLSYVFQIQTFVISLRSERSLRVAHRCTSVDFSFLRHTVLCL